MAFTLEIGRPAPDFDLPGVDAAYREISNGGTKFDLHFFVAEVAGELSLTAEYNTDIFDQARIERFLEHNLVLLEAAVADPGATVAALPILSPSERRRLLVDYNATAAEYPRATILDLVRTTAVRLPNRAAVIAGRLRDLGLVRSPAQDSRSPGRSAAGAAPRITERRAGRASRHPGPASF